MSQGEYRMLHEESVTIMRELRENGWSLEGIGRVFKIAPYTVAFLIKEKICPTSTDPARAPEPRKDEPGTASSTS